MLAPRTNHPLFGLGFPTRTTLFYFGYTYFRFYHSHRRGTNIFCRSSTTPPYDTRLKNMVLSENRVILSFVVLNGCRRFDRVSKKSVLKILKRLNVRRNLSKIGSKVSSFDKKKKNTSSKRIFRPSKTCRFYRLLVVFLRFGRSVSTTSAAPSVERSQPENDYNHNYN